MTTPIIAAARALAKQQSGADDYDALDEALQLALQEEVRVVLRAVREPSEGMVEAASDRDRFGYDPLPSETWQAMIDAALAE